MLNLKKKLFMLDKLLTDLKSPQRPYRIATDLHSQKLAEYYFIFEEKRISAGKGQKLISKFDADGIPVNKTYVDVQDKDYVYFPISIGQMGLSVFHTWLKTGKEKDKDRFMNFVNWFFTHADIHDKLGARWLTEVSLPQYHNPGPWQSAFTQSRAISILLRGYQLTAEDKYADLAEKALQSFDFPVSEGGVTSPTKSGPFYEEYTAEVPTLVLNGKIFALFGLMDFTRVFPEHTLSRKLLDEGLETLKNILPEFDMEFWSRYNLCQAPWYPKIDPATIGYQRLHINQLEVLIKYKGEPVFTHYAKIFEKQDSFLNALRMYKIKLHSLKTLQRV